MEHYSALITFSWSVLLLPSWKYFHHHVSCNSIKQWQHFTLENYCFVKNCGALVCINDFFWSVLLLPSSPWNLLPSCHPRIYYPIIFPLPTSPNPKGRLHNMFNLRLYNKVIHLTATTGCPDWLSLRNEAIAGLF